MKRTEYNTVSKAHRSLDLDSDELPRNVKYKSHSSGKFFIKPEMIKKKTGLLADPYFSGTKLAWILENVPGVRARAERGDLLFGTIECWLIWKLTGGKVHVSDYSNACRTMLFDINTLKWDEELCGLLNIPMCMLPEPVECSAHYGDTVTELFGGPIPVTGSAGDQQAALC